MILPQLSRFDKQRVSAEHGVYRHYRVRELLADGAVHRTFWFTDRDDADAFLWAAVTGSLRYERALWHMAIPIWEPPSADVVYDFATEVKILTISNTVQYWTVPSDFNRGNNTVQAIGSGGGAGCAGYPNGACGGGGGGGWARIKNAPLSPGSSAPFMCQAGGVGAYAITTAPGYPGMPSWMRTDGSTSPPTNYTNGVQGGEGGGGATGVNTVAGGFAGGTGGAANIGTETFLGGAGGAAGGSGGLAAGGGGAGAAGPYGTAPQPAFASNLGQVGSQGDNGMGGPGGGHASGGGNGTEIAAGYGSGGGGGGLLHSGGGTSGSGGIAGGGGGGASSNVENTGVRGGSGGQGAIFIIYAPSKFSGGNMPMLGI